MIDFLLRLGMPRPRVWRALRNLDRVMAASSLTVNRAGIAVLGQDPQPDPNPFPLMFVDEGC